MQSQAPRGTGRADGQIKANAVTSASRMGVLITGAILLFSWLSMSCSGGETASPNAPISTPAAVGTASIDVEKWNDPVKAVLKRHDVTLKGVDVRPSDGYRTFDVGFKFDPQSPATTEEFHKLYSEVLEANQMHGYAFRDAEDGFLIQVRFDTAKKEVTTNFVPLK
jgi:hypothetical protein